MSEGQDKQHAPTERRLRQAAEQGNVRRSGDLPKAVAVVLALLLALNDAPAMARRLSWLVASWLARAGTAAPAESLQWAGTMAREVGPVLALIAGLSAASTLLSGGWVLSGKPLLPDFSKLLPSHGLGQILSGAGLSETGKAVLKFAVIGGLGAAMITARRDDFVALARLNPHGFTGGFAMCLSGLDAICGAIAMLALGDVALQWYWHRQKLRMSDTEMRDEMKEAVGNPQVRQRQRAIARRMAKARQMRRIPEASVVVTNPTHFAVAIRYRRGVDAAPLMLAKGVGLMAEEIISRARGCGIPIVQAPPLARAMHRHVEPGEPIPVALYRACAEILAYVWRLQQWRAAGGARPKPPDGERLPIAPEMAVAAMGAEGREN